LLAIALARAREADERLATLRARARLSEMRTKMATLHAAGMGAKRIDAAGSGRI